LLEGNSGGWRRSFSDPESVFVSKSGRGILTTASGEQQADGDVFVRIAEILAKDPDLTAAGYWGYDLRHQVERLPHQAVDDLGLPDCWVGFYRGERRAEQRALEPPSSVSEPSWSFSREGYEAAVARSLQYIAAGDCYQVNLSRRFSAGFSGDPWSLFRRLQESSPAPFSAYLDCGDHQVLSSSPELFLRIHDGQVETRPIKGTRPRAADPEDDRALAEELLSSPKDRAELLMIVDLERNDLGRVCRYGSVYVPGLYRLESYANVHHLLATVRGQLRDGIGALECLRACFPGGSITGAPKIRAMEIIDELEPVTRGVYTGAIGWVDGRGNAEWNIAIRTMVVKDGRVYLHAGGGIVADSDPTAEYEETLAKASGMLRALGVERH
jgi:para-aminobenzoate synthetase component 1